MSSLRTDIEKALDEIVSSEEGMRFQGLAVVLAKNKWPELIASEHKKDLGLDAHAPGVLAQDEKGIGLACSLTAKLNKIKDDIRRIQQQAVDVKTLIFATPRRVTKHTAIEWAHTVREECGIELIIVSREDIITDLMKPSNASICRSQLGIPITVEAAVSELINKVREAASEQVDARLMHPRLADRPRIALDAIKLDQDGRETGEILDLAGLHGWLLQGRRIVLEGPPGGGKTTTLVQLAERHRDQGELAFLIDLPVWVRSGIDLLEFIASMLGFRSRGVHADDLARVSRVVPCSFLLNGWNEVSDIRSEDAVLAMTQLERSFPPAGIIVATRPHHVRPPLPGSSRMRLRALSRRQRAQYLQEALTSRAEELGAQLAGDPVLDDLTRTPLILAEVTTIFLSGGSIPKTKVGVLGAVMGLVEQADEHRDHLQRPPLRGQSRDYLAELAAQMTIQDDVTIGESSARSIVHSVSRSLSAAGQIAVVPEPAEILGALCAHHVLERVEHPSVGFRFQHQQFQEFYATFVVKRELWGVAQGDDPDENGRFARDYVNKPIWEEPLRMVAEEIGKANDEASPAVDVGRRLVELALGIDPVFAGDLSRLCGPAVWSEVRSAVGERLRAWRRDGVEHHRRCALAGMLATASDDFIDILLPLLTSDDRQVRLSGYRAWGDFHISSLGKDWRRVVGMWKEEHRADFIGQVVRERWVADIAEEFARVDPSPRVRAAALRALQWVGAGEALGRVLTGFDEEAFEEVLRDRILDSIPLGLKPRALAAYERLLRKAGDPLERLRIRLASGEAGEELVAEGVKEELTKWPSGRVPDTALGLLKSALEIVRKIDRRWVSDWVADRIVDGSLWADDWTAFVSDPPEALEQELTERISGEVLARTNLRGIVSVLAATAGPHLAGDVFSRICRLRTVPSNAEGDGPRSRWEILNQLDELFRTMPANVAVSGMLIRLSPTFDGIECSVVIDLFGRVGAEDSDLRNELRDDLRQSLRRYLKEGVPFALSQDDFSGNLKANLAVALARVGEPEDMADLHRLIRADIERLRRGRATRSSGEQGPVAQGASMVWSNWYVRAVTWLDPRRVEEILLELLCEQEYEQDAATALLQLARTQNPERGLGLRAPDYGVVWKARAGQQTIDFVEERRCRYTSAIKQRISTIMEDRSKSDDRDSFNGRLKGLARTVAVLDGRESAEFVMEIMGLRGEWDGWTRADALEALLFSGGLLGADAALRVLTPTIDHIQSRGFHDQQARYLLGRCLCLLAFLDPPSAGIARIKDTIAATRFLGYELRDVMTALGHSRCDEALGFLLELATANGTGLKGIAGELIDAIAALDTPESKRVLLSFVDPDLGDLGLAQHFEHHDREHLASRIADIGRADPTVRERLFLLCARQASPAMRLLLAEIVARLGTSRALVAGLELIDDNADPPVPHELVLGMERTYIEQRAYGNTGNVYSLEPRSANEIRRRLYEMAMNEDNRRRSAWALLGQIEVWRLEYGRPNSEPRHPAFDSGAPWPPITLAV